MVRASGRPGNRGGRRQGKPNTQYANRTDLNSGPTSQPIRTAPGQGYGVAGQQAALQRQIPLPTQAAGMPPPATPAMGGQGGTGYPQSQNTGGMPGPPQGGTPGIQPGGLGPIHAPTNRPAEPLTSGLPTGAGAGPEALAPPPNPLVHAVASLNALGKTADPGTQRIRAWLNATLNNSGAA